MSNPEAIGFFVFTLMMCVGFGVMGELNYRDHVRRMKRTQEHIDEMKQRAREREERLGSK